MSGARYADGEHCWVDVPLVPVIAMAGEFHLEPTVPLRKASSDAALRLGTAWQSTLNPQLIDTSIMLRIHVGGN